MAIRFRIIIYYSLLLIAIMGLFGAAVFGILRWTMISQVDSNLMKVLEEVEKKQKPAVFSVAQDGQPWVEVGVPELNAFRTPGIWVQIWKVVPEYELVSYSNDIHFLHESLDMEALGQAEIVRSTVTIDGVHLRVLTRPIVVGERVVGNYQAAATLTTIEAATDRLLKIMLGSGIIALLTSLMLGDWLAQRILAPVDSIVSTAQSITAADDLAQRIPYQGPNDELGRMVSAFNDTLSRLEKLFRAQRRFVGDVSHELRTPLTTIQGNLDLIRRYGMDAKSIQAAEGEVKRMTRLVGDLLLLAQADSGQMPLTNDLVDLDRLVLEVYSEAVMLGKSTHHLKLGTFDQVQFYGDADRLKQLLLNLVTNAIKYTPEGGTIDITLIKTETEAQVAIADTGVGIPPEDLEHIFDRFYRVDKARSRAAGGSGLGLSIAKWIAEAHQGRITVKSKMGEGTTFTVILPLTAVPEVPVLPAFTTSRVT